MRDPVIADLMAQAALASGWPTVHAWAASEGALLAVRARIEAVLGPLPQADVIEPFDPSDPSEPWELRIDLPGLSAQAWDNVRGPGVELVPGLREGARAADDLGHRLVDEVEADGVIATMHVHAADGGVLAPEVRNAPADDEIARLETDLQLALQRAGLPLRFHSSRGPDTLQPVVHRGTGRFGVQVHVAPTDLDAFTGEALLDLRQRLVGAVADLVRTRAGDPVRLAPDLGWDLAWGLSVTAWIIGPAVEPLPGDDPVRPGIEPFPGTLRRWLTDLDGIVADLEIQVVPETPADHDDVAHRVAGLIASDAVLPGRPRWLRTHDGTWAFCPVWRVVAEDLDASALFDALDRLSGAPGVLAVRVVPGEPTGLGESWDLLEPGWRPAANRCFVRLRDGLTDRDRLVVVEDRAPDARDVALEEKLRRIGGWLPRDGGFGRAVVDGAGRAGMELIGEPGLFREDALRRALLAVGGLDLPHLCSVAHWGYDGGRPMVQLWYQQS